MTPRAPLSHDELPVKLRCPCGFVVSAVSHESASDAMREHAHLHVQPAAVLNGPGNCG